MKTDTVPVCRAAPILGGSCGASAEIVAGLRFTCCGRQFPVVYYCDECFSRLGRGCRYCGIYDDVAVIVEPVRLVVSGK